MTPSPALATQRKSEASDETFSPACEQMETMITQLQSPSMLAAQHGELEAFVQSQGRALERRLLQAHLDLRAA